MWPRKTNTRQASKHLEFNTEATLSYVQVVGLLEVTSLVTFLVFWEASATVGLEVVCKAACDPVPPLFKVSISSLASTLGSTLIWDFVSS